MVHMKNNTILYVIIGVLSGVLLLSICFGFHSRYGHMSGWGVGMMGQQFDRQGNADFGDMDDIMDNMMSGLDSRQDEGFDKVFLQRMILHHQGAVEMAKLAQKQAKHQEIIDLSQEIIDAQTSEIEMMKSWQKNWGY